MSEREDLPIDMRFLRLVVLVLIVPLTIGGITASEDWSDGQRDVYELCKFKHHDADEYTVIRYCVCMAENAPSVQSDGDVEALDKTCRARLGTEFGSEI